MSGAARWGGHSGVRSARGSLPANRQADGRVLDITEFSHWEAH